MARTTSPSQCVFNAAQPAPQSQTICVCCCAEGCMHSTACSKTKDVQQFQCNCLLPPLVSLLLDCCSCLASYDGCAEQPSSALHLLRGGLLLGCAQRDLQEQRNGRSVFPITAAAGGHHQTGQPGSGSCQPCLGSLLLDCCFLRMFAFL